MRMVFAALVLIALRFALAAAGGEEATRFLAGNLVSETELALGALYVLVHLTAVIAAPILMLAALADRISP